MQSTVLALLIKHIAPTDFPQFVTPQCLPTALSCTWIPPNVDTSKFQVLVHLNMHLTTLVLSSLAQPLPSCPGHCCAHSWHHQPQTTTGVGSHMSVLGRWSYCLQCPSVGGPRGFHSSPPLPAPPRPRPLRAPKSPRATFSSTMYQGSCRAWPTGQPFIKWRLLVWYLRALWAHQGQGQAKPLLGLLLVPTHMTG